METNIRTFTNIFTDDELNMIENDVIVQIHKIEAETNNKTFIKFNIQIGEDIKLKLSSHNINIRNNELPMMWVKGDTNKHVDKSEEGSFNYTNLIYITDDTNGGELVIDGKSFPIKRGNGYCFNEGLEHETVGTDTDKMRLMIGPISEKGFPVGFAIPPINYMFKLPPDFSNPIFIGSNNTTYTRSQIPSDYIPIDPSDNFLIRWKVFAVYELDDTTVASGSIYNVGDSILPNVTLTDLKIYYLYPEWGPATIKYVFTSIPFPITSSTPTISAETFTPTSNSTFMTESDILTASPPPTTYFTTDYYLRKWVIFHIEQDYGASIYTVGQEINPGDAFTPDCVCWVYSKWEIKYAIEYYFPYVSPSSQYYIHKDPSGNYDNTSFIYKSDIPPEYIPVIPGYPVIDLSGWIVNNIIYDSSGTPTYNIGDNIPAGTPNPNDYIYRVIPNFVPGSSPTPSRPVYRISAYSNNSLVFYKPHSMASGGTAGVRNARVKSRRT